MTDTQKQHAAEQIRTLFGVSWDRVLQWLVVAYASAWFYLAHLEGSGLGPVEWGVRGAAGLGIPVPDWVADAPRWLDAADRDWLWWALPLAAAAAATSVVARRRVVGGIVLSIAALLLAIERAGSLAPVWLALAACAAIGLAAMLVSGMQRWERTSTDRHYRPSFIAIDFTLGALAPFWMVLGAPLFALAALVAAYGRDLDTDPRVDLLDTAMRRLRTAGPSLSEAPADDVVSALVGALLADSATDRRAMAMSLRAAQQLPLGAATPPTR